MTPHENAVVAHLISLYRLSSSKNAEAALHQAYQYGRNVDVMPLAKPACQAPKPT